jgi:hypothetical protein
MVCCSFLMIWECAQEFRATFSDSEKKNYISAVQCIAKLPGKTPKSVCPGCKNRYDDFVATHIQQTFSVRHASKRRLQLLTLITRFITRATSFRGIAILLMPTSRHFAMNVVTRATIRMYHSVSTIIYPRTDLILATTTGPAGLRTQINLLLWTAA